MKSMHLPDIYRSTNANTLEIWKKNEGIGEVREQHYYDPVKLSLAAGIQPSMPSSVSQLIDELNKVTRDDPLADILPTRGFHFTFLPLTLQQYMADEPLPAKVEQLTPIWAEYDAQKIIIRNLRLVALPSQLLLAGIPEEPAVAMRQSFCEKILASDWKDELLMRHSNSPLPAPFWHSTLLRYNAAFLPEALRQFFLERQDIDYGDVDGELVLARISYNWTTCYPVAI